MCVYTHENNIQNCQHIRILKCAILPPFVPIPIPIWYQRSIVLHFPLPIEQEFDKTQKYNENSDLIIIDQRSIFIIHCTNNSKKHKNNIANKPKIYPPGMSALTSYIPTWYVSINKIYPPTVSEQNALKI